MFVTNFQDSEDKYRQFTVEIFKIQGVWFYHTFCFISKNFENKQIMFVTNFQDTKTVKTGAYSLLLRFFKSKEFGSTTHFTSYQIFFENK